MLAFLFLIANPTATLEAAVMDFVRTLVRCPLLNGRWAVVGVNEYRQSKQDPLHTPTHTHTHTHTHTYTYTYVHLRAHALTHTHANANTNIQNTRLSAGADEDGRVAPVAGPVPRQQRDRPAGGGSCEGAAGGVVVVVVVGSVGSGLI